MTRENKAEKKLTSSQPKPEPARFDLASIDKNALYKEVPARISRNLHLGDETDLYNGAGNDYDTHVIQNKDSQLFVDGELHDESRVFTNPQGKPYLILAVTSRSGEVLSVWSHDITQTEEEAEEEKAECDFLDKIED